jgi:hypothetical protein
LKLKKATRKGGTERKIIMKDTMIIAMNELMNNYRHFKEEVKKNFFWDDMKDVTFEVETGYDRYKDWGSQICSKNIC